MRRALVRATRKIYHSHEFVSIDPGLLSFGGASNLFNSEIPNFNREEQALLNNKDFMEKCLRRLMMEKSMVGPRHNAAKAPEEVDDDLNENFSVHSSEFEDEEDKNDSMLKMFAGMCKIQNKNLQRQVELDEKQKVKDLPIINKKGIEWITFYRAFIDSKDKFTAQENIVRLQRAIKCDEIKQLGGITLFLPDTYEETLKNLNDRLNKNHNLLLDNLKKLLNMPNPSNGRCNIALINFINEVRNYANLQMKVGTLSTQTETSTLLSLTKMLPYTIRFKWSMHYSEIQNENRAASIIDFSDFLSKFLPAYETLEQISELSKLA